MNGAVNLARNPNYSQEPELPLTDDAQKKEQERQRANMVNMQMSQSQVNSLMGPIWNLEGTPANNYTEKDFVYNSQADNRAPTFNEWTKSHDDNCSEESRLRISTKPMKYYVNLFNSPQVDPYTEYTVVGNQQAYHVRNDFERAEPTRLNPLYPVNVEPFPTTPFLGNVAESRLYADSGSNLRFGDHLREHKSTVALTEKDFNRFDPGVYGQTVQNAGQFQQQKFHDGYFNYHEPNNVILGNSSAPYFGLSSRNLMDNILNLSGC